MYIHNVFFTSKLALGLVLLFLVVRTVLLPGRIEKSLSPVSAMGTETMRVDETSTSPALSSADYAQIVAKNPFGSSERSTAAGKWTLTTDDDQLGLTLFGTIAGSPAVARAVIKDIKTGVLDLYRLGQSVGGARIESIETDAVILMHDGRKKILKLNIAQSGSNNLNRSSSLVTRRSSQGARATGDKIKAVKTGLSVEHAVTGIQNKIGGVDAILKKAVVEPYVVDGQVEGLRITGLENIEAAKELGLKNGDVIRVVNGHRLTSKQKAFQIFKKARSQKAVSLELLRDDKTKTLSFNLR